MSSTAVPPSLRRASACCDPGELGLGAGREAVLPAGVVGEFVVAPVALVERRVAQDGVGAQLREGRRRAGCRRAAPRTVDRACRASRSAVSAARSGALSWAYSSWSGRGATAREQGAGAAGGVEEGAGGAGEVGHQPGEFGGGERVLARVGVEVPAEQELEGLAGADLGGQFGGAAQEGGGGEELRGRRGRERRAGC